MKTIKVIYLVLAALIAFPSAMKGQDPHSLYAGKTYQWKDESGQVHTSRLLDEAMDPYQIMGLVKAVFTDRDIPGTIADPTPAHLFPASREKGLTAIYNYPEGLEDYGIPAGDYTPRQEGLTALLVKIKNGFDHSLGGLSNLEAIKTGIESVRLLPSFVELEGNNPGVLFNVNDNLNRFFIMTKGKLRRTSGIPFGSMFEEYSPCSSTTRVYNAYKEMLAGNHYMVDHDCTGVLGNWHPTCMGGQHDEQKVSANMLVYVPYYRFAKAADGSDPTVYRPTYESGRPQTFAFYNKDYAPYFLFYTIGLRVDDVAVPDDYSEANRMNIVNLTWETDFHKILNGEELMEQFRLYRVVDGRKEMVPAEDLVVSDPSVIITGSGTDYTIRRKYHIVSLGVKES